MITDLQTGLTFSPENRSGNIGKRYAAENALDFISEFKPDLMFADIHLSSPVSKIDIVKQAQQERDIPVIYITGNSDKLNKKEPGKLITLISLSSLFT